MRPTWTLAGYLQAVLLGLAPGGVCRAAASPRRWCALTAPFHPCLCGALERLRHRRCVSVALSRGFPRVVPRPPCPAVSGLSSTGCLSRRGCLACTVEGSGGSAGLRAVGDRLRVDDLARIEDVVGI